MQTLYQIGVEKFMSMPLSMALTYVINDIQQLKDNGLKITLEEYFSTDPESKQLCGVCLAGAALLSLVTDSTFGEYPNIKTTFDIKIGQHYKAIIASTFDDIRLGYIEAAIRRWTNLDIHIDRPIHAKRFGNTLNDEQFDVFVKSLKKTVLDLQKYDY